MGTSAMRRSSPAVARVAGRPSEVGTGSTVPTRGGSGAAAGCEPPTERHHPQLVFYLMSWFDDFCFWFAGGVCPYHHFFSGLHDGSFNSRHILNR